MSLFVEKDFFLRTIEDAGAHPSGQPQIKDKYAIQYYFSPNYGSKVLIDISDDVLSKTTVEFYLDKLVLLELLPTFFQD
jgi:hypothetical protein